MAGAAAYAVQLLQTLKQPNELKWDAKFEISASLPDIAGILPASNGSFFGTALTATSEESFSRKRGFYRFEGNWLVLGVEYKLSNEDPTNPSLPMPPTAEPEYDATIYSPYWIGANPGTFFGEFTRSAIAGGGQSTGGFTIGWGKGFFNEEGGDGAANSIAIASGVSIPVTPGRYFI